MANRTANTQACFCTHNRSPPALYTCSTYECTEQENPHLYSTEQSSSVSENNITQRKSYCSQLVHTDFISLSTLSQMFLLTSVDLHFLKEFAVFARQNKWMNYFLKLEWKHTRILKPSSHEKYQRSRRLWQNICFPFSLKVSLFVIFFLNTKPTHFKYNKEWRFLRY